MGQALQNGEPDLMHEFGIWIAIVFPIVVGVVTALVLAFYGDGKPESQKTSWRQPRRRRFPV